jgi:hypothetical protein
VIDQGARAGSIAGASGDAGVEYRRGVAAYAVACGLSGVPLPGIELAPADAYVLSVALETDDPVDDIRIDFTSGCRALVQAKRRLDAGKPFKDSVKQWVAAAEAGLDPDKDRLIVAAGSLSGSMKHLREVLNRNRTQYPGTPTRSEKAELDRLDGLLATLTPSQRMTVHACAVILEMPVETPDDTAAQNAIAHLRHVVKDGLNSTARLMWLALMASAGQVARLRGGHGLAGWLDAIRRTGVEIATIGATPAVELELSALALEKYRERLVRAGSQIDFRGLGAGFASLQLDSADARVMVGLDPEDEREESELLWAFLRRRRVLLTGLPGGGKSTALRGLAGKLASDPAMPIPVPVSLRDERVLADPGTSFRDRIVRLAVKDSVEADRRLVIAEIERRLAGDRPVALLLDALDETYDQRADVVREIEELASDLPDGVSILLATRDVAYAQAATLGWADLRLRQPKESSKTVGAVLAAAAESKVPDPADRPDWVAQRASWVNAAVAQERALGETPLFPVLLALLAAERSTDNLPDQRAHVLQAVICDVIAKREVDRIADQPLGSLQGTAKTDALILAFWVEGSTIVQSGDPATSSDVRTAVSAAIGRQWALAPGHADAAATDTTRLFDESGVFVFTGADEAVIPRIALFAEIGDATLIAGHPDDAPDWVAARVAADQLEALVLAATLSTVVTTEAQKALMLPSATVELAEALARALHEGVTFEEASVQRIAELLIARAGDGTREGWRAWAHLLDLPIPHDARPAAIASVSRLGDDYATFAQATLLVRFPPERWTEADLAPLRDMLRLRSLKRLPAGNTSTGTSSFGDAFSDGGLTAMQVKAAAILLEFDSEAADLIAERARSSKMARRPSGLLALLKEHGHTHLAEEIEKDIANTLSGIRIPDYFQGTAETDFLRILTLLAEPAPMPLTPRQETDLDELADLAETLGLNDPSVVHFYKMDTDELREIVELVVRLNRFDPAVTSAEAMLLLNRLERWPGHDAYYALFDNARGRRESTWDDIDDVDRAAKLLMRLLVLGPGQAHLGMCSLWDAPLTSESEGRLRALVPELKSSTEHQRYAALALASLSTTPEPESWLASADPVLRRVAADFVESAGPELCDLLDDPDGYVQETAIEQLIRLAPTDLESTLRAISGRPNPAWMCLACRTTNRGGARGCAKEGCYSAGPDPAAIARKALDAVHGSFE